MTTEQTETATSVTIITLGYRERCTAAGCGNLGRVILRHSDAGGRPIDNAEFCLRHGRARIKSYRAAGLRVYDDRLRDSMDGPRQ
jgi:hypothetical protein